MIINEAPIDNAWYRASGAWFIALMAINCLMWPVLDYFKYVLSNFWWLAALIPAGSFVLFLMGKSLGEPDRVLLFAAVIGIFGIIPLLIGALLPFVILLILSNNESIGSNIFAVACAFVSAYWVVYEIRSLRIRLANDKFIDRQFRITKKIIYLKRSYERHDRRPVDPNHASLLARFGLQALVFALPLAYPLQRLFFNAGQVPGVVFLLALLGTPLAIYILGRTACGFYLWIYTVRKIELQNGRPVVFEPSANKT